MIESLPEELHHLEVEQIHRLRAETVFGGLGAGFLRDLRVLEIAPFNGWITGPLLRFGVQTVHAVEASSAAVAEIERKFPEDLRSGRLRLTKGDAHVELQSVRPGDADVIVCMGFLYHTPHLFWILELMARAAPQRILIETFTIREADIKIGYDDADNRPGMRFAPPRSLPFRPVISEEKLIEGMQAMGYEVDHVVQKDGVDLSWVQSPENKTYMQKWQRDQSTIWFRRGF